MSDLTRLQDELIKAGASSVTFKNWTLENPVTLEIKDLPDNSIVRLFNTGRLAFGDSVNSYKETPEQSKQEYALRMIEQYKTGDFKTLRKVSDPRSKIYNEVVLQAYIDLTKHTAKDARKDLKENPIAVIAERILLDNNQEPSEESVKKLGLRLKERFEAKTDSIYHVSKVDDLTGLLD